MEREEAFRILSEKLGEDVAKVIIEYVESIRYKVVTTDVLIKLLESQKEEILARLEKDKSEILARLEKDKAEIFSRLEKNKAEIFSRLEKDKAELSAKIDELHVSMEKEMRRLLIWIIGFIVGWSSLLIAVFSFIK